MMRNPTAIVLPETYLKREEDRQIIEALPVTRDGFRMPRPGAGFKAFGQVWIVKKVRSRGRMTVKCLGQSE